MSSKYPEEFKRDVVSQALWSDRFRRAVAESLGIPVTTVQRWVAAWAALMTNQATGFPVIRSGGAVSRGGNAAAACLTPGVPMGPAPVWTVRQPWPL